MKYAVLVPLLFAACQTTMAAQETALIPPGARLEELWNAGEFTEGVAVRADGQVFFSDIATDAQVNGRILQFDPTTRQTTVFAADSRKSNGLFFDGTGRLLACCGANGGAMALCQVTTDGQVQPLVERYQGKRFNAPNDLVVSGQRVYFSDPRYIGPEPIEMDHQSVFLFDLETQDLQRLQIDIQKPNGVHISPDGSTLYVAETNNGSTGQDPNQKPTPGRMTLNAFRILKDGTLTDKQVLVDFGDQLGTDGMAIDANGNIYAAVRSPKRFGIVVYSPKGDELAYLPTPTLPTNCCFGTGSNASTLYVTAGGGLYQITLNARGAGSGN